ncbi:hypothetical protein QE377_000618 [Microbacterium sp. SORGH_AS 862]|nr:hypothetical protein [Microbacterium sp. SORGH_AS_0862]
MLLHPGARAPGKGKETRGGESLAPRLRASGYPKTTRKIEPGWCTLTVNGPIEREDAFQLLQYAKGVLRCL